MKEKNEFEELDKLLGAFPEFEPSEKLKASFIQQLNQEAAPPKNKYLNSKALIIIGILLFITIWGFIYNSNLRKDKEMQELKQEIENTQKLLFANLAAESGPAQKMLTIHQLKNNDAGLNKDQIESLFTLFKNEGNDNVKLALLQFIGRHSEIGLVQEELMECLIRENNPLVMISMINILIEVKTNKGMKILQQMELKEELHPIVKNHLRKKLEI